MYKFKKIILSGLLVIAGLCVSQTYTMATPPVDPLDPLYVAQTLEIKFASELTQLVSDLDEDPVKIFYWVRHHISNEEYTLSRKGALNTYMTGGGNQWDQCTLLITLLRIAGIPARYARITATNYVFAEAYLPVENYRGSGNGAQKEWLPLVPWEKEILEGEGLDLFPGGTIPAGLEFNFFEFLSSVEAKTAAELYEEKIRSYLVTNHPGKSMNSLGDQSVVDKTQTTVLATSLPKNTATPALSDCEFYEEIPVEFRAYVDIELVNETSQTVFMDERIYLASISGKPASIDFIPENSTAETTIASYGSMYATPLNAASLSAVIRINGNIVATSSSPINTQVPFHAVISGPNSFSSERSTLKAGTFIAMSFDILSASKRNVQKVKSELDLGNHQQTVAQDSTRHEFLERLGFIMTQSYLEEHLRMQKKLDHLMYCNRNYGSNTLQPTFLSVFPPSPSVNEDSQYSLQLDWKVDALGEFGQVYKSNVTPVQYLDPASDFVVQLTLLHRYSTSMNEGLVFGDWQNSEGISAVKGIKFANDQGITLLALTSADVSGGTVPDLLNQGANQWDSATISAVATLLQQGKTVIISQKKPDLNGFVVNSLYIAFDSNAQSFILNQKDGGEVLAEGESNLYLSAISSNFNTADFEGYQNTQGQIELMPGHLAGAAISSDGDPVDLVKGEFYTTNPADILIPAKGYYLSVQRQYRSQLNYNGPFGYGWAWNHSEKLIVGYNGDVIYYDWEGRGMYITKNGDGTYTLPPGIFFKFEKVGNQYIITEKNLNQIIFSESGQLIKEQNPNGHYLEFSYDAAGRMKSIKDVMNRSLEFVYNSANKIKEVKDFTGRSVYYAYSGDDLVSFTDLNGETTTYEYLGGQSIAHLNHNMSKYTLPNDDYIEIHYYTNDTVAFQRNILGEEFHFEYNPVDNIAKTWNMEGFFRKIFYNENHDVIRVTDKDQSIQTMEYNDQHQLTAYIDGNGNRTEYTYDANGNRTSVKNALGDKWVYTYDLEINQPLTITDPKGNITEFEYNDNGDLTQKTDALGNTWTYAYDSSGNLLRETDALSNSAFYEYDVNGIFQIAAIDKNGHRVQKQYDPVGNLTQVTDAANQKTSFTYNAIGQKTSATNALGQTTQFEYDSVGNLIKTTYPNGAEVTHEYEHYRDLEVTSGVSKTTDPLGYSEFFTYDTLGKVTESINKRGARTRYFYDGLGRLTEVMDAFQNSSRSVYDNNGNIVKTIDALGVETHFEFDALNRLIKTTDAGNHTVQTSYNALGQVYQIIDAAGSITEYTYDTLNRVIQITADKNGPSPRVSQFVYDELSRVVKIRNPAGNYVTYDYDPAGNKVKESYYEGAPFSSNLRSTTRFIYDARNQLVTVVDALGNTTSVEYDALGRKAATIDAKNYRTEFTYDTVGNLIEATDQAGFTTRYTYDLNNRKIAVTNALNETTRFVYGPAGDLERIIDPAGNAVDYYYDTLGRQISAVNALGAMATTDYDALSRVAASTDPMGNTFRNQFNQLNQIVARLNPLGNKIQYTYDDKGNLETVKDPLDHVTAYEYNAFNEMTTGTNALLVEVSQVFDPVNLHTTFTDGRQNQSRVHYDVFGQVIKSVQGLGTALENETRYAYDERGNLIKETNALGAVTEYIYDERNLLTEQRIKGSDTQEDLVFTFTYGPRGELLTVTDPKGNVSQFAYDALGRQYKTIDAKGNASTIQYDSRGQVVSETNALGESIYYEYDALGRQVKTIHEGDESHAVYDLNNRLIEVTNFKGVKTTVQYDSLGQITLVTEAVGTPEERTTEYFYDETGNTLQIKNALNKSVYYEYDDLSRLTKKIDADSTYETFTYDNNSNLITHTKRGGQVITHTYDALDRLTEISSASQTLQTFSYDLLSRMTQAVDTNEGRATHTVDFTYDLFNQVIVEDQDGKEVKTGYDQNGNPFDLLYPGQKRVTRTFDILNLPTLIEDQAGHLVTMQYDALGRRTESTMGNGLTLTQQYTRKGQEKERAYTQAGTVFFRQESSYDAGGNVISENILKHNASLIKQYTYDSLDQLTQQTVNKNGSSTTQKWQYDKIGNWTYTNQNGVEETRTVNDDNEYTAVTGMSPSYNDDGNLIADGTLTYIYDWANRLVEVQSASQSIVKYTYDALNRRVLKIDPQTSDVRLFVYDGNQVIEEYFNTTLERSYVYNSGIDDPVMMEYNSERYYYLKDRQGSITAITDASGNMVETYEYNAFGIMTVFNASGTPISESTVGNPYGYTGRRWDNETGLWYYRNRMYDPRLGRFLQRDPLGYVDGMNMYAYVVNNPRNFVDPMGLASRCPSCGVIHGINISLDSSSNGLDNQIGHSINNAISELSNGTIGLRHCSQCSNGSNSSNSQGSSGLGSGSDDQPWGGSNNTNNGSSTSNNSGVSYPEGYGKEARNKAKVSSNYLYESSYGRGGPLNPEEIGYEPPRFGEYLTGYDSNWHVQLGGVNPWVYENIYGLATKKFMKYIKLAKIEDLKNWEKAKELGLSNNYLGSSKSSSKKGSSSSKKQSSVSNSSAESKAAKARRQEKLRIQKEREEAWNSLRNSLDDNNVRGASLSNYFEDFIYGASNSAGAGYAVGFGQSIGNSFLGAINFAFDPVATANTIGTSAVNFFRNANSNGGIFNYTSDLINQGYHNFITASPFEQGRMVGVFFGNVNMGIATYSLLRSPSSNLSEMGVTNRLGGQGFNSFNALKRHLGPAGKGNAWHHIVEQTKGNVQRFGSEVIHNTSNIVKVPHGKGSLHSKISGFYSSKQPFTGGKTVRQWISNKSYDEQFKFGQKIMERFKNQ